MDCGPGQPLLIHWGFMWEHPRNWEKAPRLRVLGADVFQVAKDLQAAGTPVPLYP